MIPAFSVQINQMTKEGYRILSEDEIEELTTSFYPFIPMLFTHPFFVTVYIDPKGRLVEMNCLGSHEQFSTSVFLEKLLPIELKPELQLAANLILREPGMEFLLPFIWEEQTQWMRGYSLPAASLGKEEGKILMLQPVNELVKLKNKFDQLKEIVDAQELHKEEQSIRQFQLNIRLETITNKLMELAKDKDVQLGNWEEALAKMVTSLAMFLQITRVSVWEYDEELKGIRSIQLYNQGIITNDPLEILELSVPTYFGTVVKQQVIVAPKAQENSLTKEFTDNYLKPLQIKSMLDVPYFINEKLGGVICCEQQYKEYDWAPEDILLVRGVADILTIAWKSHKRKLAEETLHESREKIKHQNRMLEIQRDEIRFMNDRLEEKVNERTEQLFKRNQQLEEFAFINAHKLRGPLSRIKGLVYLIQKDPNVEEYRNDLMNYLSVSAEELDEVVKHITKKLDEDL